MAFVKQKKLELLAPAGSLESFFAAFENGADAVFCGLTSFSARAKAKNFSLEELDRLSGYAHSRKKKIYIALNTLINEAELPFLVEVLHEVERVCVDGLIIQDFGLYRLAHTCFPSIPLHASTQMVIHNLAGVRLLEKLGFERAVLARELSLNEILYIAKNSALDLEHFVHGALCYSISGHCLFSSYIDGRSGNRGRCIQPCRRRYHHKEKPGFYFSTSDFSALEFIPKLAQAGIMSLKIEGRMKSAEYVASVVAAYRIMIDAKSGTEKEAIVKAQEKLGNAMGRQSSSGFLQGIIDKNIVLAHQKGGIGKIIGKVGRLQGKSVSFTTRESIYVGDRVRIQPGNDRAGQSFTVKKMYLGKRAVKRADKGNTVSMPFPFKGKARVGDLVFKLATGKALTMSSEVCLRRLKSAPLQSYSVSLDIECSGDSLNIRGTSDTGIVMRRDYPVEMIVAKRSPLTRQTLEKVFSRTGFPTVTLKNLYAEHLPPVVIKPSRLKEIRRDFYGEFAALLETKQTEQAQERVERVHREIQNFGLSSEVVQQAESLYIVTDSILDLKGVGSNPDLQFIVPLNEQMLIETGKYAWDSFDRARVIWDIPSIVFDSTWKALANLVAEVLAAGFVRFRFNNSAHFELLNNSVSVQLMAGPWLYSLNSQTMSAMEELGIHKYCVSIEDDKENIKKLLAGKKGPEMLITVYSPVDLFTSRISPTINKKNFSVQNDKGDQFHLQKYSGITVTRADKHFSLLGKISQLRQMGCCNYIVDVSGIGFLTHTGQEIMDAFAADHLLPGTMDLNFERGLI